MISINIKKSVCVLYYYIYYRCLLCCVLHIVQQELWPPCSKHLNPSESGMKDFSLFPVVFFSPHSLLWSLSPLSLPINLSFSPFSPRCLSPCLSVTHLLRTFLLFYSPSPSRVAALGSAELPPPASFSESVAMANRAQITNNGMLIMVITL